MKKMIKLFLTSILFSLVYSYGCCDSNTLQVVGAATVLVWPDIAQFSVSATSQGNTSAIALANVNKVINQAIAILKSNGFPTTNYTTSTVSIYPLYNYENGTSILIGQQAYQSLSITVGNLATNKNNLSNLVTALSAVSNLTISGFSFTLLNNTSAYSLARKTAVSNAQATAKQYATLSGLKFGSVRKIIDQGQQYFIPFYIPANYYSLQAKSLAIPYGQVSIRASVEIDWSISS